MPQVDPRPELVGALAEVELPAADESVVRLGDLWTRRTVVLVHLRHFGCILCRRFVERLGAAHPRFRAAAVDVVAVGTGGRRYAQEFVQTRRVPFPVLVDKSLCSHEIIGVRSGRPVGILAPGVLLSGLRAALAGEMQGRTGPHPFVFGATHVIAAGGDLRFAWLDADYNDHPPVDELLAAAGIQ